MSHAYQIYIMGKTMIKFENHYSRNRIKVNLDINDSNNVLRTI